MAPRKVAKPKKTAQYYAKNPKARAKKKAYDTKYHKSAKRRKYRADLNKERRRRGIVGKGGNGASVGEVSPDMDGGAAIILNSDIRLSNSGIIGGGGGGGNVDIGEGSGTAEAAGGGGAGYFNGIAGTSTSATGNKASSTQAANGTNTTGGAGGIATNDAIPEPSLAYGGDGGDLGAAGGSASEGAGGAAGAAIELNGYTITYDLTGTILGTVS